MQRIFSFIYNKLQHYKFFTLASTAVITVLCLYAGQHLEMEESITAMLPSSDPLVADQMLIYGNFDYNNRLFLEVAQTDGQSEDLDGLVATADKLYEKLEESQLFSHITYRADDSFMVDGFGFLSSHFPVLCGPEQQAKLAELLTPSAIQQQFSDNRRFLMETPGQLPKMMVMQDPLNLRQIYWPVLAAVNSGNQNKLHQGVIVSADEKAVMMVAQTPYPATVFSKSAKMLEQVDAIIAQTMEQTGNRYAIHYTGAHPAVCDNNVMIRRDIGLTVTISLIAITLLVFLAYRRLYLVFFSYLPVLFGGAVGLAIFSLFSNEIQGVVVGFSSCLIGISVDYAIHILYRFDRAPAGQSTVKLLAPLALPVVLGATTTIGAFLCLHASELPGQRQLGTVAALGIFAAMFFSLFLLPQFLPAVTKASRHPLVALDQWMEKFFGWYDHHRKLMAVVVLVLWVVALSGLPHTRIDGDMHNLNGLTPKTALQEQIIANRWGQELLSELLLVASGASQEEVVGQQYALLPFLKEQLAAGHIKSFSTTAELLPPRAVQEQNRLKFNQIITAQDDLTSRVNAAVTAAGFKAGAWDNYLASLQQAAQNPLVTPDDLIQLLPDMVASYYSKTADGQYLGLVRVALSAGEAPAVTSALTEKFPKIHWYHGQTYTEHLSELVTSSMIHFGVISLAVVCLIVLFTMGRLELLLLVIYAMGSAMLWTFGILGHLRVSINLMSSLFVVFVFGMSVDYVIFVINEMMLTRQGVKGDRGGTSGAIILSAMTTIAALGSLALAQHPAMNSVGFTAAVGMTSGMVAALIAVPLLLKPLSQSGSGRPLPTIKNLLNTGLGYGVFMAGAFMGTLFYPVLHLILGRQPEKLATVISGYLSFICRVTLAILPFGKFIVEGRELLANSQPRIILCNHESMLDILLVLAYVPNSRMVVKNWVWKAPCMGFLVKKAGFLLVDGQGEEFVNKAGVVLQQGHNLLIFPEGSRQIKNGLGRFHRGAYEMALRAGVPIQEILLARTRSGIAKGSVIVNTFTIKMVILPPRSVSGDSRQLARESQTRLQESYQQALHQMVTTDNFRQELLSYYNYTGPYIENYCYFKMKMDPIFAGIEAFMPESGQILDLGCGYGLMTNILAYASPRRTIWAIDYDESKLAVARSCSMYPATCQYNCDNLLTTTLPTAAAGALLIDVLHYWHEDQQLLILRKISSALDIGATFIMRDGCQEQAGFQKISFFEKLSTGIGHNRTSQGLNFLTREKYQALLEQVGFQVIACHPELGRGSNLTFVCQKVA